MKKNKKNEVSPKQVFTPYTGTDTAKGLVSDVAESAADHIIAYKDIDGVGRITAEKMNMPGGTSEYKLTAVPKPTKKKYLRDDVKAMKKNGESMEEIARKTGMSTSYAYKLNRED